MVCFWVVPATLSILDNVGSKTAIQQTDYARCIKPCHVLEFSIAWTGNECLEWTETLLIIIWVSASILIVDFSANIVAGLSNLLNSSLARGGRVRLEKKRRVLYLFFLSIGNDWLYFSWFAIVWYRNYWHSNILPSTSVLHPLKIRWLCFSCSELHDNFFEIILTSYNQRIMS